MRFTTGAMTSDYLIARAKARDARPVWRQAAHVAVLPGLDLFRLRTFSAEPMRIATSAARPGVCFGMRVLFTGADRQHVGGNPYAIEPDHQRYAIYSVPDGLSSTVEQPAGIAVDQVAFLADRAALGRLLPDERLPQSLARLRDGRIEPFVATPALGARILDLAADLRAQPFDGPLGRLYAQSHLLGLLSGMIDDLTDYTVPVLTASGAARRRVALSARDLLLARLDDPPSLPDLAAAVGVGPRRLNAAFREAFGASVFDCLLRWRLDVARHLIATGALPLKQIAFRAGYRHVSNFTTAYARVFGETPAQTRRK